MTGSSPYAVERHGPPPPRAAVHQKRYPFAEMPVGSSFFAPKVQLATVRQAARRASAVLATRFVCREVVEDGVQGVRCWRMA